MSTIASQGALVDDAYFTVAETYGIGKRYETFAQACEAALSSIVTFTYEGQGPDGADLVHYSRAFVELRETEPIQPREHGLKSGSDGPILRWEVFNDGVIRRFK